jgi:predicted ATPase
LPNNLPVQLTSFVGRERELAETRKLLSHTPLLTLIGPGGTGKTRLTLQLAAEILPEFPDGVWLVQLAQLADPALVLPTIAAELGIREVPGVLLIDLVTRFVESRQLLIILDNCEHLVESCAQQAEHLLSHCPSLKMIASSREALGIAGETVYRVPPLALPPVGRAALETMQQSEAVQLFIQRAAAVKPNIVLNERNAPAVAQICRRLDGIPLALELAAARVALLTPEQIATHLDDRFRLLTGGSRTALPRQQTLRSLIDWSYDLLSEPECLLFCQLSVFVGGWSLEAAEAVSPELDVLELLAQLVQKSLVVVEERGEPAATRFRLLETIRQYARDKLLKRGNVEQVRDRHLEYYLNFVEAGEPNLYGPHRLEWIDRFELDLDNFRAALQWGLEYNIDAALRLGGALPVVWVSRGLREGRSWLQAALDRAAALPEPQGDEASHSRQAALAKGLVGLGQIAYGDGDYQSGLEASEQAVSLYKQLGDPFGLGFALSSLGNMAAYQGDLDVAEQTLNEAIRVGREHAIKLILAYATGVLSRSVYLPRGDLSRARTLAEESMHYSQEIGLPWSVAQSELILARIDAIQGQVDVARAHALSALAVAQELRDPSLMYIATFHLGDVELCAGNLMEAQQHHRQTILACQEFGQFALAAHELESFAYIAQAQNQPVRAARLLGAAEAVQKSIGTSAIGVERLQDEYQKAVAWLQSQLDESALAAIWSEGCALTMDQAISYAVEQDNV